MNSSTDTQTCCSRADHATTSESLARAHTSQLEATTAHRQTTRPRMQNSDNCYATLENPFHRLTGHDSSTPTDTTPKSSGVVPPRYAAAHQVAPPSVAAIQNQTATVPGQHGVPFLTRRLDDQRNKPSRAPQGKTPADHRLRNDQLWVHGTVWHSKRVQPRIPVDILLDTGAGGRVLHVRSPILYTPTVGRSQPKAKRKR